MKTPKSIWYYLYNLVIIHAMYFGVRVAGLFNDKIRMGVRGRHRLFEALSQARASLEPGRRFVVIHCASAGEFEAARPLLTALKQRLPHLKAHVTCYSPSGMRGLSQAPEVESYSYLPFDHRRSARKFLKILNPAAVIIVKHDVWPNLVWAAAEAGLPSLWVNANLHQHTRRLWFWTKNLNSSFLNHLTAVLTVSQDHARRLEKLVDPGKIHVIGDSRYDRTLDRLTHANGEVSVNLPTTWGNGARIIIGGSTWGPDQRLLIPVFARLKQTWPDLHLILVPHEPAEDFLTDTITYLDGYGLTGARYTQLNGRIPSLDVLIVDKVGLLASLYHAAWAAYVGGAFGQGVHSVLEPAVFNLPLFFGPKHYMANEANALISAGGAWSVTSANELENHLRRLLEDDRFRQAAAKASGDFVRAGAGATGRIIDFLERAI
jgi:3-deoxy-D-manno-octulosonic-acid transferase